MRRLTAATGAKLGAAVSCYCNSTLVNGYPSDAVLETALPPGVLTGEAAACPPPGTILHSIVPTLHWARRADAGFATFLDDVAALIPTADIETARIAAGYALVAGLCPDARLVFASSDRKRLNALLHAFRQIEAHDLVPRIADLFARRRDEAPSV